MSKFTKRIVRPGVYTVRRKDGAVDKVKVDSTRIDKWVSNFNKMKSAGLRIPAPWRHEEEAVPVTLDAKPEDFNSYNNAGFWNELFVGKDGALWGEVDIPLVKDAVKIGKTVEDVSLLAKPQWVDGAGNAYDDAITHIALVTHPVAKDDMGFIQKESESAPATIALSMADFFAAEEHDSSAGAGVRASAAGVKDIMQLLQDVVSVTLPEDTTVDNFLERLAVALAAIRGHDDDEGENEGSLREPPKGTRNQPGPVAMSKEIELALSLLGTHKAINPATKKPYTQADLDALLKSDPQPEAKLSAEDQATINWARRTVLDGYKSRIENCVSTGRVDPKTAKTFWDQMNSDQDLRFSFDQEGKPVPSHYDFVLNAWEVNPANMALTGHSPTSARATKARVFGGDAFSLDAGLREEPREHDAMDDLSPLSDDEADAVLAIQFASSGTPDSQVEGGYRKR